VKVNKVAEVGTEGGYEHSRRRRTMERHPETMMAFPVATTPVVMFGGICWTLSVLYFPAQAVVQAASARPYSLATNLISDLGNTACGPTVCSPLHGLMNATFIAVGVLHWAGAIATQQAWPPGQQRTLSAALLWRTLGAVLLVLAGDGLLEAGCPRRTSTPRCTRRSRSWVLPASTPACWCSAC
jgi:hypothetical protein